MRHRSRIASRRPARRIGYAAALACVLTLVGAGCGSSEDALQQPTPSAVTSSTASSPTEPSPTASSSTSSPTDSDGRVGSDMLFNGADHWGGDVDVSCPAGKDVRIIVVRGTLENVGDGSLGELARMIDDGVGGRAAIDDLDYPASWEAGSEARGVNMLVKTLNAQAQACPDVKTVLLGYSQGAMVVGDALSAPDVRFNKDDGQRVSARALTNIAAVELFGDPRFDGSADYDTGDYDRSVDGILGARGGDDLRALSGRIISYCNADDFACQLGGHGDAHGLYRSNGSFDDAAQYAVTRIHTALGE
ncbi:cutinase family protein [Bifidobacterium anseris]|nr:cutinase family protein [Bifidobacterium anseris]